MMNNVTVDKKSNVYRQNLVKAARTNLLVAVLFTVLNVVMLLARTNRYFLFSMTLPYWLTFFGYTFDFFQVGTYTYTGLVLAAVPLLAAALCWFMSKKRHLWLWGGTIVFGLDTLAMLGMIIWSGDVASMIIDIVFHGWVLYTLIHGLVAVHALRKNVPLECWDNPPDTPQEVVKTENPVIDMDCSV